MTFAENRIVRLELMVTRLQQQIATLQGQAAALEGQARQSNGVAYNWGGGGGVGGDFVCQSIPAIAGGASGTGNVYLRNATGLVLVTTGATIWNEYASATTAGRKCTLAQNVDGSYSILGQSCT
jgi:hypothetical protein